MPDHRPYTCPLCGHSAGHTPATLAAADESAPGNPVRRIVCASCGETVPREGLRDQMPPRELLRRAA